MVEMREDSPTNFVRFKRRRAVYERGLEVVLVVQRALDHVKARHYLKDKIDKNVTAIVMEIARAQMELPSQRWRGFRAAHKIALECMVQLDILAAQQKQPDDHLVRAAAATRALCEELADLGKGR